MEGPARIEISESHEYIRHISGLYAAWFTFFLTITLAANAWGFRASVDKDGKLVTPFLFYGILAFFEIQIVLGIIGTGVIRASLVQRDNRALELLKHIAAGFGGARVQSPVPNGLHQALGVMNGALWVNLILWPIVAAVVWWCAKNNVPLAVSPPSGTG
jgi:hypothetical protein